jgi:hypothetical protein
MQHILTDDKVAGDAGVLCFCGEALCIGIQDFVGADIDPKRRQTGQIGE